MRDPDGREVMPPSNITIEVAAGLATLTLARPQAGNALDRATCEQFANAAENLAARGDVRAILLTAEGKTFCVGGDISGMSGAAEARTTALAEMVEPLHRGLATLAQLDAPLVAAVRGAAAGAGLSLLACADLVIAAPNARFIMAYSAIGLSPDGGATWNLPRVIGVRRTLELALTNRRLNAEEAREWGLVTQIVDDATLDDEAASIARKLAAGPTRAFGITRRLIAASITADFTDHLDAELAAIRMTGATEDAGTAIAAFRDKRSPEFSGH